MPNYCMYGFGTNVAADFTAVLARVERLLSKHGFQVYTRLNLQDIIGETKIDKIGQYIILGACNAEFAKELFAADPDIGLLMPCNIIIYEAGGETRVMIKDPLRVMDLIRNPIAIQAAMKVKEQMEEIIDELREEEGR